MVEFVLKNGESFMFILLQMVEKWARSKIWKCNNGGWREEEDDVVTRTKFILNLAQHVLWPDETSSPMEEEARVRH